MLGFGFKQIGGVPFDSATAAKLIAGAARQTMSKAGAFVRQRAKTSIRKRKKPSPPGQPPSSHEGSLRRLIFFALDPSGKSLVVGPVPFKRGDAPALLEHGGTANRKRKDGTARRLRYRGNPFMKPAAEAELPKFRDLLRNMVN